MATENGQDNGIGRTMDDAGNATGQGPGEAMAMPPAGPTVTKESIEANILGVEYITPFGTHTHFTICAIKMKNGFLVLGKSAPVSPLNFNAEVGKRIAYQNAFDQIWALEGYALASRLAETPVIK